MTSRRQTGLPRPLAAAAGVVLDRVAHEPPAAVHPVVLFGRSMTRVERQLYRDTRTAGLVHAATGAALGFGTGAILRSTSLATGLAVAGRALADAATQIGDSLEVGDLDRARALLPTMVGRDPEGLDAKEMARAVVESVAENTVDGVIGPALWGAVAGAPGALGFRAVNTLDSMVGHRSPRYANYGWASARADDVMAFIPSRLTAVLVGLVRPAAAGEIWRAVRTQAPAHPSPNSGVAEAAFAAALGLRLGGLSRYGGRVELRPPLGTGRPAEPADVARAVKLSLDVGAGLAVGLGALGAWQWMRRIR